jgi:hypothetical protein
MGMTLKSLTLREEHRFNYDLVRIFGHKKKEITGGWENLCNE